MPNRFMLLRARFEINRIGGVDHNNTSTMLLTMGCPMFLPVASHSNRLAWLRDCSLAHQVQCSVQNFFTIEGTVVNTVNDLHRSRPTHEFFNLGFNEANLGT